MFDNPVLLFGGGAAAVGLIASFWGHLRNVWQQVSGRLVVNVAASGYQSDAMQLYLNDKFVASRFGPRHYTGWLLHVQPKHRTQLVAMEIIGPRGRLFWQGWRPLWVTRTQDDDSVDMEEGVNSRDYYANTLNMSFLRGTFDADELILGSCEHFNRRVVAENEAEREQRRRHYVKHIYGTAGKILRPAHNSPADGGGPVSSGDTRACLHHRPVGWQMHELGLASGEQGSAVGQLALTDEALELVDEAHFWRNNEDWYRERGIPWRRGWLLHGEPGTGKTALIRAIAEDLDLPVFVYDLASLHNEELQQAWSGMLAEVPCMAVIEDVDAVFDGRRNIVGRDQHLTFDCLLNCLDGIERANGLMVAITTNHIEQVDAALGRPASDGDSTRPGRIDRTLCLGPLDDRTRLKMALRILSEWPDRISGIVRTGEGDTAARFQERCSREALELLWNRSSETDRSAADAIVGPGSVRPSVRTEHHGDAAVSAGQRPAGSSA